MQSSEPISTDGAPAHEQVNYAQSWPFTFQRWSFTVIGVFVGLCSVGFLGIAGLNTWKWGGAAHLVFGILFASIAAVMSYAAIAVARHPSTIRLTLDRARNHIAVHQRGLGYRSEVLVSFADVRHVCIEQVSVGRSQIKMACLQLMPEAAISRPVAITDPWLGRSTKIERIAVPWFPGKGRTLVEEAHHIAALIGVAVV